MQIEDVKGEELRELIEEVHRGSMTIESDFEDAIRTSNTEDELINIWQSALEGLKNEVEHYWSELEGMKNAKPVNIETLSALVEENKRLEKEIEEFNKGGKQCSK